MKAKKTKTALDSIQLAYYHDMRNTETGYSRREWASAKEAIARPQNCVYKTQIIHPAYSAFKLARAMYENLEKDRLDSIKWNLKALAEANYRNLALPVSSDHIGCLVQCVPVGNYQYIQTDYDYLSKITYRLIDIEPSQDYGINLKYRLQVVSNEPIHKAGHSIKRNDLVGAIHVFNYIIPMEYPKTTQTKYRQAA